MIIGHGVVASLFLNSSVNFSDFNIFASGVSRSTETDPAAFQRELQLLENYLFKDKTLVYFSTVSLFDPTKTDSPYILHKKQIEELIQAHAHSYLIVRLPILLSHGNNPYTLFNYLATAIRNGQRISLHSRACRFLLDADDLVPLLQPFLNPRPIQKIIHIPGSPKISMPELITKIETIIGKKGDYVWIDEGACYDIPPSAGECVWSHRENYIDESLRKYLKSTT